MRWARHTFKVDVSDGGVTGTLEIVDSLNPLPGSDTWSADTPAAFGIGEGSVASWGDSKAQLHGAGAVPVLVLDGFTQETKEGDTGSGEKQYPEGAIPAGAITWRCVLKN